MNLGVDPKNDTIEGVFGVHDFFQFKQHILHKMITRGWRMTSTELDHVAQKWKTSEDPDFELALKGLSLSKRISPTILSYDQIAPLFKTLERVEVGPVIDVSELETLTTINCHTSSNTLENFTQHLAKICASNL
jgi:hypothetical protein